MNDGYWFVSYSRQQFYFAESLAVSLQKKNVRVWFDIQKLDPGSDWVAGIQKGLDECIGMILVASKASLSSRYVQQEIQMMLEQNKPVYIVLFEAVDLPETLIDCSRIDFRGDFGRNLERLIQLINS